MEKKELLSKPTLTYLNIAGLALATRVALRYAKVEFEDEKISSLELSKQRSEKGYNEKFPTGQVPVLNIMDGCVYNQSMSIARWAAKKSDLYPSNENDALLVDCKGFILFFLFFFRNNKTKVVWKTP